MKPFAAISILLLIPAGMTVLRAQPAPGAATKTVLILLRQPEGTLAKRLAEASPATPVPDELRAAAQREQASMAQAQREAFEQRMGAAGATQVTHYPELNLVRAEVPQFALSSLQSDPAVVSVIPISEDAQAVAGAKTIPLPAAAPGAGVPPAAGVAAGLLGRKFDALQPPSLSTTIQPGMPAARAAALSPALMPSMQQPPMQMPGMPMPGMPSSMMPGLPGSGGMFQSLLGVTGQMGMQAGSAMPRAAGLAMLLSGTAQLAQVVLANRRPGCAMTLANAGTQLPEAGGQGVIAVNAPPSCLWQPHSDADWLRIDSEGPMMGPGIVKYTASPAGVGVLRTGVISMAGIANNKVKGQTSITVRQGQ